MVGLRCRNEGEGVREADRVGRDGTVDVLGKELPERIVSYNILYLKNILKTVDRYFRLNFLLYSGVFL